jgi:hypothetical protein
MFDLFRFGVLAIPILNACASRAASMSPAQSTRNHPQLRIPIIPIVVESFRTVLLHFCRLPDAGPSPGVGSLANQLPF